MHPQSNEILSRDSATFPLLDLLCSGPTAGLRSSSMLGAVVAKRMMPPRYARECAGCSAISISIAYVI
jgi:hypothetical protein